MFDNLCSSEPMMPSLFSPLFPRQDAKSTREVNATHVGGLLGSGGFCAVFEATLNLNTVVCGADNKDDNGTQATSPCSQSTDASDDFSLYSSYANVRSGHFSFDTSRSSVETKYALKRVKKEVLQCPRRGRRACKDLVREAKVLSKLPRHPHIIRLQGLSVDFWDSSTVPADKYLLLEILDSTLEDRLDGWSDDNEMVAESSSRGNKQVRISLESQRLLDAGLLGIAKALQFLHANHVIFRDVKPKNIGYAWDGSVRLFDFGVARFVSPDQTYCMTFAGTVRYMAPEIIVDHLYDQSVDVYALGLVLWETCTLQVPYHNARDVEQLERWIGQGKNRPNVRQKVASPQLREVIERCLRPVAAQRITAAQLVEQLAR